MLLQLVQLRKEKLIEILIRNGIYKTSDQKHLYDAPLQELEKEYIKILNGKNF
ncbi:MULTISPECIES: Fur-regulated basic protein FbpA [unclassified Bacillus (in: firmicutes)]|uniref:Fur-regulated basic protein FbpA n=1 Tax=unclassified Bacillus (in: firmicutes) TaxID=185979 RepID=UPI0020C92AB8|nr:MULTISPECIES: Fur-regulated basic protein FbpA [unclassified Bacillus (in: firmicutes)]